MLIEIPDEMLKAVTKRYPNAADRTELLIHIEQQYARHLDAANRRSDNSVIVTISDPITGEVLESQEIVDTYSLVCAGSCILAHENQYPRSGTVQLTIKGVRF